MEQPLQNGNGATGRTQSLFREVNERIIEIVGAASVPGERIEIVCECGSDECTIPIGVSPEEYEEVRRIPTRFLVKPAHVVPEAERVVLRTDGYWVVEKFGEAGTAAVRLDPRRRRAGLAAVAG